MVLISIVEPPPSRGTEYGDWTNYINMSIHSLNNFIVLYELAHTVTHKELSSGGHGVYWRHNFLKLLKLFNCDFLSEQLKESFLAHDLAVTLPKEYSWIEDLMIKYPDDGYLQTHYYKRNEYIFEYNDNYVSPKINLSFYNNNINIADLIYNENDNYYYFESENKNWKFGSLGLNTYGTIYWFLYQQFMFDNFKVVEW